MSLRTAFTKWSDILHLALGAVAGVLVRFPMGWAVSFAITVIYIMYQAAQVEEPLESYADMIEYLCGFILGLVVALAKI